MQVLEKSGYTFYVDYQNYDDGAYNFSLGIGNIEEGISFNTYVYNGQFHELEFVNTNKKINEQIYYSGKHTGGQKSWASYLAVLKEICISRKEFMNFL